MVTGSLSFSGSCQRGEKPHHAETSRQESIDYGKDSDLAPEAGP